MIYSRIVGTGSCLPENVVTNADLATRVETSDEWIRTRTGICQRHLAAPGQTSSVLAFEAAQRAIPVERAAQERERFVDRVDMGLRFGAHRKTPFELELRKTPVVMALPPSRAHPERGAGA